MDPFDAFDSSSQPAGEFGGESDPAADFLAREQAELAKIENNEADFFSSDANNAPSSSAGDFGSEFNSNREKQPIFFF